MPLALPAHLQGRQSHGIAEKAAVGIGASLPPHISIRGNTFTLVDAAGNEHNAGPTLDICVVDCAEQPQKRYYAEKWTPQSNDPPLCFSTNGIVPSRESVEVQSRTCAECTWNERGSATSAISGAAIKACRDEKWLAVLLPQFPQMLFQLVITPGSFKNWQAFTKNFSGSVDISDVITRISFQPQVNGVLVFEILGYAQNSPQFITQDLLKVLEAAWAEKKTDALVGRENGPIALAAPVQPAQVEQPAPFVPQQPAAFQPAPMAAAQPSQPAFAPSATGAAPTTDPAPLRRRRRTAAEMAQANQPAPAAQPQPMQAPFAPQAQPAPFQPAAAGAPTPNFGMQAGAAPNPELAATLEGLFGKK